MAPWAETQCLSKFAQTLISGRAKNFGPCNERPRNDCVCSKEWLITGVAAAMRMQARAICSSTDSGHRFGQIGYQGGNVRLAVLLLSSG